MPSAFIPFWQLRQHAVVEEVVRGGSRRRRTDAWLLSDDVKERLRPLLERHGFDLTQAIRVEEAAGEDGFSLRQ